MKKVLPAFLLLFGLSAMPASALVINEFVVNGNPEWIEFYNEQESAEYIKQYYIDDDLLFTESDETGSGKRVLTNLNTNDIHYPFFDLTSAIFNNGGDYVVLFDGSGTIVDQYQYTSDPGLEVSIGRNPDKSGSFGALEASTKGAANPGVMSTATPVPTVEPTNEPTPTNEPEPTPPSPTQEPVATPTETPVPTLTPMPTGVVTPTPTDVPRKGTTWKCELTFKTISFWKLTVRIPRFVCMRS